MQTDINFKKFNKKTLGLLDPPVKEVSLSKDIYNIKDGVSVRLQKYQAYWESLYQMRKDRKRAREYYIGNQWGELIKDPKSGKMITEEEYIISQGRPALKQNHIRQYMKTLIGNFWQNETKTIIQSRSGNNNKEKEMMTNALDYVHQVNVTEQLDARNYEEYLLSGIPFQKLTCKYIKERNRNEIFIENCNNNRLFFNSDVKDPRLTDLRVIGYLHDSTIDEVIASFAKTESEAETLREIYGDRSREHFISQQGLNSRDLDSLNFLFPNDMTKCRVIEAWELRGEWRTWAHDTAVGKKYITKKSLKEIDAFNKKRIEDAAQFNIAPEDVPIIKAKKMYEQFWYYTFYTPYGHILKEGESIYEHEEHPFVLALYPLIDGHVWGFVKDIIDQQRQINRLYIINDMILSTSSKGVLMIPEDQMGDYTPEQFADQWTKFNGVIIYKPSTKHNHMPKQIVSNSTNVGINEMLAQTISSLDQISGVHGAMQGLTANPGTSGVLYAQQAQNANINTLDYVKTYNFFKQKRDYKAIKLIKQYFDTEMYLSVSGKEYSEEAKMFKPSDIANMDFDAVISQNVDTPMYRQMTDDLLVKLLEMQQIPLEIFLEHTSMPFAEKLLDSVKNAKQQAAQSQGQPGQAPMQIAPQDLEVLKQGAQAGNPEAMALLQRAIAA